MSYFLLTNLGKGLRLADELCRTGASKVLPVVHIARRLPWEQVKEAEKDLDDLSPVTAPAPNRSGELRYVSPWTK